MEIKRLASGSLVEVLSGIAQPLRCDWMVRVPVAHPEPDFPEDLYAIVPCGARVRSLDGKTDLNHTTCGNGHDHHTYGSREWADAEAQHELRERLGFYSETGD